MLAIPANVRSLGQAVRWAREEQGLTLRMLARKVGLSVVYLSDLEHDRLRGISRLKDLAKALNVSLEDLESRAGMTQDLNDWLSTRPDLIALLRAIRNCQCR